jgi:hypothetical protein
MPMWLSGDSTNLVSWDTNIGGSSPSIGSVNNGFVAELAYAQD